MVTASSTATEIAAKGEEIYKTIRLAVEPGRVGEFVSIDVNSGAYRLGADHLAALDSLQAAVPDAVIYTKRIGYDAAVVVGGSWRREAPLR